VARTVLRGELLAQRRKAAGWTQAQLAAQLGAAGRLRVGQWERGLEQPRYIPRLAAALHLDAVELLAVEVQNPPLQALRLAAGLTLAEIAAATGMAHSTYYRLENGLVRANPYPRQRRHSRTRSAAAQQKSFGRSLRPASADDTTEPNSLSSTSTLKRS